MKVLHLSQFDEYGGAARASYRLHDGLRKLGVTSRMLVQTKTSADPDVSELRVPPGHRFVRRAEYELGVQYAYLPTGVTLRRHPWTREADVIQLGNIHGGGFSLTSLPHLARKRRVVWTLHDMWAFTGHCGYASCDRWLVGCGRCPDLATYPAIRRDATRANVHLKRGVYGDLDLTVVAPSRWLCELAGRSPLLGRFPRHVIPYGIDTDAFAPLDRDAARTALGLPGDETLVLVVGIEPRKGSNLLGSILSEAARASGRTVTLVVAGTTEQGEVPRGVPTHLLGSMDEVGMRRAYAAADVYLLPTVDDNLPNTVLEALACGAPVVTTPTGGIPDVVRDGETGLLAPVDAQALGRAVAQALTDRSLARRIGEGGRALALAELTLERQARSYRELYLAAGR
jgi:glycosyltransferase involved in cell wall biosynthesis